jgi:membrane fusion protein, multidrug efflux system
MKLNRHIFSFLVAGFIFSSCGNKQNQTPQGPPPATPVTIAEVRSTNAVYYDNFPGTVTALNEIKLTSQVSGYITDINFSDGQNVKKGQLLYKIDNQVYKANYEKSVADLQVQEANLVKAQKDAARYEELDKHDAIAKQQVDYANATLAATQKQVNAAKANVASLLSNVQFANIYAPFSGTIGISQVKKGTAVVAGQTVLNTISTNNPIAVDFTVDQKNIYRFSELEQKKDNVKDSVFTIAFGSEVYPYPGKIDFIDRAVDPQTGTIKVRLSFPNDKDMLKPGMNTNVRVKNTASKNATIIPHIAVNEQLGEFSVYVLGDSSIVHQQQIELGMAIGDSIIVKAGLNPGEKIVVQGIQNLHDGTVVKVSE